MLTPCNTNTANPEISGRQRPTEVRLLKRWEVNQSWPGWSGCGGVGGRERKREKEIESFIRLQEREKDTLVAGDSQSSCHIFFVLPFSVNVKSQNARDTSSNYTRSDCNDINPIFSFHRAQVKGYSSSSVTFAYCASSASFLCLASWDTAFCLTTI